MKNHGDKKIYSTLLKIFIPLAVVAVFVQGTGYGFWMNSSEEEVTSGQPEKGWENRCSTPEYGGFGEALAGTGDYIYAVKCAYSYSTPKLWRYDPYGDAWETMNASNLYSGAFRNGTTLAWDSNDRLYCMAGARYSDFNRREFYCYSISDDSWTPLADTPYDQGAGDALIWSGYNDRLYAVMGSSVHETAFGAYDPETDSWTLFSDPPAITDDGCSLAWTGGRYLYCLRGENYETLPLRDFWRYDMQSDTWSSLNKIPEASGVGDGGSLLYIGNWEPGQSDFIYALGGNSCWEDPGYGFFRYTISTDLWEKLDDLPYPVGSFNGSRIGYAAGSIYCWQGSPDYYPGGGDKFFSYPISSSPATPTRTPTPTVTPTAECSATPAPSPTPFTSDFAVQLEMPAHYFSWGNICRLNAYLYNCSDNELFNVPLVVILDVYGQYWYWNRWTPDFDYNLIRLPPGVSEKEIISSFVWPDMGNDELTGIIFWGAMLNENMNGILGGMDGISQWNFGYGPR